MRNAPDLRVYLVTDAEQCESMGRSVRETVEAAVEGGATCVQLRAKTSDGGPFLDEVCEVANAVGDQVPVIVNDRVDVFLAARALGVPVAGVHVGQADLPAKVVREMIGEVAFLGLSVGTDEEARIAASEGVADHVGLSVLRTTATKTDTPDVLGYDGCERLARLAVMPSVAIGGVGIDDMAPLKARGVNGAAVVSAICCAEDPKQAARDLLNAWSSAPGAGRQEATGVSDR